MSGEEMIPCPYNYSHIIMKSRMANHLMKCRQQFPLENYTTCPFNATHDVPVPELKYHVDTCPDRKTMESFLYVMDDQKEEESTPAKLQVPSLEENWDEDKASGSYLQAKTKVVEEQMLFRPPVGRSKSEKKAFLQSQVKKFQNIDEGNLNVQEHMPGPSCLATEVSDKKESKPLETVSGKVTSDTDSENFKIVMRKSKKSSASRGMRLKETH